MKERLYGLPEQKRIHRQHEYRQIFKDGRRIRYPEFVIIYRPNGLAYSRIGISVGRKFGKAVSRNRAKRLCRELFRLNQHNLPAGIDFVFLPRKRLLSTDWKRLLQRIAAAGKHIERDSIKKAYR